MEQLAEMLYVTPDLFVEKPLKASHRRWANQLFNSNPLKPCERIAEKNDSLSVKEVAKKRLVTKMPIISVNYSKKYYGKIPSQFLR